MKHARVLSKAAITPTHIYILGGNTNPNNQASCEIMDRYTGEWRLENINKMNLIKNWKCFAYSQTTLTVQDGPASDNGKSMRKNPDIDWSKMSIIMGTDDEPFLLYICHQTIQMEVIPVPLSLKLKNYQGACRLDDEHVFLGGGINKELKRIFSRSYVFNIRTHHVRVCEPMPNIRYTFPVVKLNVNFKVTFCLLFVCLC